MLKRKITPNGCAKQLVLPAFWVRMVDLGDEVEITIGSDQELILKPVRDSP